MFSLAGPEKLYNFLSLSLSFDLFLYSNSFYSTIRTSLLILVTFCWTNEDWESDFGCSLVLPKKPDELDNIFEVIRRTSFEEFLLSDLFSGLILF